MIGGGALPNRRSVGLFGAASIAVLLGAVVLGWNSWRPVGTRDFHAESDPWVLPQMQYVDVEADVAILRARRPWGGTGGFRDIDGSLPPQAAAIGQPWRFVGTVARNGDTYALLDVGGQLKYLATGDSLPDKGIITQIERDSLTVEAPAGSSNGRTTYRLFDELRRR